MEVKNLLMFNKEGKPLNLNYDSSLDMWNGKMFFDKNSIDTFKTQGIYTFEKVQGTNNTLQTTLEKFQVFNTNGFLTFPVFNALSLEITNIETTTNDSAYSTKWIYATDIEKTYYPGMWIYFKGLLNYSGIADFDEHTGLGLVQARKVIAVEPGRVLIVTDTNNATPLIVFVPSSTIKIVPMNILEVQQITASEPVWNDINLTSLLFKNKKISLVTNSENSGIYTLNEVVLNRTRDFLILQSNLFAPVTGDKLIINLNLHTSNIPVSNGITSFGVTNVSEIQLPYIPSFLKVGDTIQAFVKLVALFLGNDAYLTITAINKLTNTITVSTPLTAQTVDCYINLGTNILSIVQDIVLDNNNTYSLPLTYWTIVNKWNPILTLIPGGGRLEYLSNTDELLITSDFTDTFMSITVELQHVVGVNTVGVLNPVATYDVYPLWLTEPLIAEERIEKDSTSYNRTILFTVIDNFGLNVNINGSSYNVDQDFNISPIVTVTNTVGDWITKYAATLLSVGVVVTQVTTTNPGDTLVIESEFPNIPVFTQLRMGDFADYYVSYKSLTFSNIKSQLLITVNGINYYVPFDTNDVTTVTNWVSTHKDILKTYGVVVFNISNAIVFNVLDPEKILTITYNIGYIPKSGDLSVYELIIASNARGGLIAGNEIRCVTGTYNFDDFYSTGQRIAIDGATKLSQNKSYNIIGLTSDKISLSYQGPFWQQGILFPLHIVSDFFIRFPKYGLTDYSNRAILRWSWKDTQLNDFFFYDFSGAQLKPPTNFPDYVGIKPLCGTNGEIELKLIDKPNTDLNLIAEPTKQQTVFDTIEYTLPYTDDNTDNGKDPEPAQVFIGYRADYESWSKARLYLELIENVKFNLTTATNLTDNLWIFTDNYVEVQSPTVPFDFNLLGFITGQVVEIDAIDVNTDGRQIAVLNNGGKKYKIQQVLHNKIIFDTVILEETSIKSVAKTTAPYYDNTGNALFENRTLNVSLTVVPKVITYIDVYGESEDEDERHRINLNNRKINILKLQDFFIFKEVDIKEQGIDWIILNRKRKELLEIYPELFNNISNYKSVIQAINFFGYNDLSFTEYFQNINPESSKFGQLFNMELLNIFNKNVEGWEYSNIAFENLRNEGFRKTNLFSLNYKITDTDGNFISAYSLDEVRIKLLGLKKWLTENIVPLGTKIIDITGKYQMPQQFILKHETYNSKTFRVEEYATPVDFRTTGYLTPVISGSDTYDISIDFFSAGNIEWFSYRIRTFYLEEWNKLIPYYVGNKVYHGGVVWKCSANTLTGDEPSITSSWTQVSLDSLLSNQILSDYKFDNTGTSFTVNKLVDPHFIVEVSWHSGYSSTLLNRKVYSVIPNFFDNINI